MCPAMVCLPLKQLVCVPVWLVVFGSGCVSPVPHRVSRFVFRLPSPGGRCLLQPPIMFFQFVSPLIVFHLSSSCVPVVFQAASQMLFPSIIRFLDVVSELPPRFLHLLSSCFSTCLQDVVSRMWSPSCLLNFLGVVFQMLSPTC